MRKGYKKQLEKTQKMIDNNVYLLHKGLDTVVFQLKEDKKYFLSFLDNPNKIKDEIIGDIEERYIYIRGVKFKIEKFGKIGEREIYNIQDEREVNIIQVRIRVDFKKKNTNQYSNIDFKGEFMYFYYKDLFNDFCDLFKIDLDERGIVKKYDYCFDVINASVSDFDIKEGKKRTYKDIKNKENLIESIKKMSFVEFEESFEISGRKWKGEYFDLVVYNKRLDIYENHKKFEDIKQIYFGDYLYNYSSYITRLEYSKRAKSLRNKPNNSFNEIKQDIERDAIKGINKKINIRFEKIANYNFNFSNIIIEKKDDIVTQSMLIKREKFYKTMFKAYLKKVLLPTTNDLDKNEIVGRDISIQKLEERREHKISELVNEVLENYYLVKC